MSNRLVRFTLLADGPSDRCLLPLLRWLVGEIAASVIVEASFADLRPLPTTGGRLDERIPLTLQYYPCDLLFVHRDAEREPASNRFQEITQAIDDVGAGQRWIGVVPIRMTESWMLCEERAIRLAADNPNGTAPLNLPRLRDLEDIPDPKQVLRKALELACEKRGRRLDQFRRDLPWRAQRVAELIEEPARLRELTAFRRLEADARAALEAL